MLYVHAGAWKRLPIGGLPKSYLSLVYPYVSEYPKRESLVWMGILNILSFEPAGVSVDYCSFTSLC